MSLFLFQLNQQNAGSETVKNVNGFIENKSIYVTNYSKDFGGSAGAGYVNTVSQSNAIIGNKSLPAVTESSASALPGSRGVVPSGVSLGNGHVVRQQSSTDETEIELKQDIPPSELLPPDAPTPAPTTTPTPTPVPFPARPTPSNTCDTTGRTHPPVSVSVSDSATSSKVLVQVRDRDSANSGVICDRSSNTNTNITRTAGSGPYSARTSCATVSDTIRTPERRPSSPFINGRTEVLIGQDAASEKIRTTAVVENHRSNLSVSDSPNSNRLV